MASVEAEWSVSLDVDCPKCEKFVNLMDYSDFWEGKTGLQIAEHNTKRSDNLEVVCPECSHEFTVKCVW